jgi:hypothetical protein
MRSRTAPLGGTPSCAPPSDDSGARQPPRTALEGLLGSAAAIALDVGRGVLVDREVPTLIEL